MYHVACSNSKQAFDTHSSANICKPRQKVHVYRNHVRLKSSLLGGMPMAAGSLRTRVCLQPVWWAARKRSALRLASAEMHRLLPLERVSVSLPHKTPHIRAHSSGKETLEEELHRLASYAQTSVSLKATLDTGLGLLLPEAEGATLNKR